MSLTESTIKSIAMVCSICGLVLLFVLSHSIKIPEATIDNIPEDKEVSIEGKISELRPTTNGTWVTIQQTVNKSFYLPEKPELRVGELVRIAGTRQKARFTVKRFKKEP